MSRGATDWDFKLHRQIKDLGSEMGENVRNVSIGLYAPKHPHSLGHRVRRDISYGLDARHRLDLHFRGDTAVEPRTVLCFVHGGGFVGGDKTRAGEPFYDNIGRWAVESGFVAVNITYRLAPGFTYPAGAEDIAAALCWVEENVAAYGGEPDSIILMGHSAGAAHVATFVASTELYAMLKYGLKGVILSSGVYDPSAGPDSWAAYYGEDRRLLPLRSSVEGLCETDIPLLVSTAEFDPLNIQLQTLRLVNAYFERHGCLPKFVQAQGHNHFSVMLHIGTTETWFTDRVKRFIEGACS
jgi:triacylglycerol lipase